MDDEPLIPPRGEIPLGSFMRSRFGPLLRSRWFIAGLVLAGLFIAIDVALRGVVSEPRSDFRDLERLSPAALRALFWVHEALLALCEVIPQIGVIVMVWIAFARAEWSDRLLWSTAMILTTEILTLLPLLRDFMKAPFSVNFPWVSLVQGLITYGTWLLISNRSGMSFRVRMAVEPLLCIALFAVVAGPLLLRDENVVQVLCGVLFTAACFAFGVVAAEKSGVDLFELAPSSERFE